MGIALSGNGSTGRCSGAVGRAVDRPRARGRQAVTRPHAGVVRYDERPRRGAPGSRVTRSAEGSHGEASSEVGGVRSVVVAIVITAAVVMGLNALANLAAGPAPVPAATTTVQSSLPAGH